MNGQSEPGEQELRKLKEDVLNATPETHKEEMVLQKVSEDSLQSGHGPTSLLEKKKAMQQNVQDGLK